MLKSNEDKTVADVIAAEITKWIKLLVNNVNMFTGDAVQYLKELRSHGKLDKMCNKTISASVSECIYSS